MSINVTNLPAYVDQQRLPLIAKTVMGSKSTKLFTPQVGVKSQAAINIVTPSIVFGDGSACGWNDATSVAMSQRTIKVANLKVNSTLCDKTLLSKWAGYEVQVAAGAKSLPFEEDFANSIVVAVNDEVEKAIWVGDVSTGTGNLAKIDGIVTILGAESTAVDVTLGKTDILADVKAVYEAIPAGAMKQNPAIFMSEANFRKYIGALTSANLYHFKEDAEFGGIAYPGDNRVMVYSTNGLDGKDNIVALPLALTFFGCDMENDSEVFDLWYSKDNREFRLAIEFNAGVQVAFPDYCVLGA